MRDTIKLLQQFKDYNEVLKDCTNWDIFVNNVQKNGKFYLGIDPTASSLHLGHLLPLTVARMLQTLKMKPIILIGGFTAQIGDPSGKSQERNLLAVKEVKKNVQKITEQIQKLLPKGQIISNEDWFCKMPIVEYFREYGKHMSLAAMVSKEQIKNRLSSVGISYTEFSYMLLQAIDFYTLHKKYNCNIQIGGSDQWGNIVEGIELIRKKTLTNTDPNVAGVTFNLLLKADGTKFGKTAENTVWIDQNLTPTYNVFQYLLNLDDTTAERFIKYFVLKPKAELEKTLETLKNDKKNKALQIYLAKVIITWIHSEEDFEKVKKVSEFLFSDLTTTSFSDSEWNLIIKEIGFKKLTKGNLSISLINAGIITSRREFNELLIQKALRINGVVIESDAQLNTFKYIFKKYSVFNKGKKERIIISY